MRRLGALALVVAVAFALTGAGCAHGREPEPVVRLDGSPRIPDDEGVATALTTSSITLDGERTYRVSRRLVSFSTYTGKVEPMLGRAGQYVQVGLDDEGGERAVVWMAGIAAVVTTTPPSVFYTGVLVRRQGADRLVFRDGTVLRLAEGVPAPDDPAQVTVRIDPASHAAVEVAAR